MKKVLIITYYWPPSGGGGVQRWLKFAKYLPEFGWTPIIYTPSNPQFENIDERLSKDINPELKVFTQPISEPYKLFNRLFFFKKRSFKQGVVSEKSKRSIFESLVSWIRGNLFVPDPKVNWVKPSVKYLNSLIRSENIKHVVTTGPPHSMHLIGLKLKEKNEILWTADFRDPWSDWDILDLFHLSNRSREKHKRLEEQVVNNADAVISVSKSWGRALQQRYDKKTTLITNGYDQEDFEAFQAVRVNEFRMLHAGLLNSYRNNGSLWQVLEELLREDDDFSKVFKLVLAGNVTAEATRQIKNFPMLSERTIVLGYIDHNALMEEYAKAAILLLLQNDSKNSMGHIPAKVFEYLATDIPICAIGNPESDLKHIIEEYNPIEICAPDDLVLQKANISTVFNSFHDNKALPKRKDPEDFQRKRLTKTLAEVLNSLDRTKT